MKSLLPLIASVLVAQSTAAGDIERIWLTHKTNDPSKIVVNWMSDEPGESVVRFGLSSEYGETVRVDANTTLHHAEIPLKHRDARLSVNAPVRSDCALDRLQASSVAARSSLTGAKAAVSRA